jgi:hypothetical protein
MKQQSVKLDEKATAKLEAQHKRVQDEISKLSPDKQKQLKAVQKLVDHEIAENNALYFGDGMFAVDGFLKRNGLSGSDKEELGSVISKTNKGQIFVFRNKPFIKSHDGLVHNVKDYIASLEMTIVEQVQYKEVKYVSYTSELDKLGFLDLIKLAFKKILKKGETNG